MRAVLFDVDGVLIHSLFHPDTGQRRAWHQHMLDDLGVSPEAFQTFFGQEFREIVIGRKSLVVELDAFLPTIGYKGNVLDFLAYWFARDTQVNIPLVRLIGQLRRSPDLRLFMATNQEHLRAHYLWTELRLGHVFDDMFYAARLGAAKPDRTFFERVAQRLGKQEIRPLFFDDSPKVIDAARSFGWEAVLYNELTDFTGHPWVQERLERVAGSQP